MTNREIALLILGVGLVLLAILWWAHQASKPKPSIAAAAAQAPSPEEVASDLPAEPAPDEPAANKQPLENTLMSMKDDAAAFVASSANRIAQTAGKTLSDAVDKAKADIVAEYEAKIAVLQKDAEDAKAIYTATIADLEVKLAAATKPAV